jgi:Mn2+/Fe2+ NRAMP family transporter
MFNDLKVNRILMAIFGVLLLGLGIAFAVVAGITNIPDSISGACVTEIKDNKNRNIGFGSAIAVLGAIVLGFLAFDMKSDSPHVMIDRSIVGLYGLVVLSVGIALLVLVNTNNTKFGLNQDCVDQIKLHKTWGNAIGGVSAGVGAIILGYLGWDLSPLNK